MLYRIRVDLSFYDLDPAEDILDKARDFLDDAVTINPGEINEEKGFIILEQCYHDIDPAGPCTILKAYHPE